ncbi:hypothetical protein HKCCSP123_10305 [Rhodobacterales bacterium HKCCSP123]|nr:hypothetical protein [Rhodobacterales bacterium HKCCSP123]
MDDTRLIFGLGSGRCGTTSLATLLNGIPGVVCFHESNAMGMAWSGAEHAVHSVLNDFQAVLAGGPRAVSVDLGAYRPLEGFDPLHRLKTLERVRAIGDVASWYLPYVELILEREPNAVFPCLRRDRQETVESFVRKVTVLRPRTLGGRPFGKRRQVAAQRQRNHWVDHDGSRWIASPRYDRCFPHYEQGLTLEQAIGRYHDAYYRTAEALAARHPGAVRVFDVTALNSAAGQAGILDFCGITAAAGYRPAHVNRG